MNLRCSPELFVFFLFLLMLFRSLFTSLGKNAVSLVMNINIRENFSEISEISILAKNESMGVIVNAILERITPHDNCRLVSFFATAELVDNLESLALLSTFEQTLIPFKTVSYKKHDVVVCIAPIFVHDQWQNFFLSAHIYKQFGAFLHVYFISAVSSYFKVMKEYEEEGFLTIQPWVKVVFPNVPQSILDPYFEVELQNLAAAQTDCILQYKESAKYIALFEIDDILIPKLAPTLIEEFQILSSKYHTEAILAYQQHDFHVQVSNRTQFSIEKSVKSLRRANTFGAQKIVFNPSVLNFTWINVPPFVPNGAEKYEITENWITHLKYITWSDDESDVKYSQAQLNRDILQNIELDLLRMKNIKTISDLIPKLPKTHFFTDIVLDCFTKHFPGFHNNPDIFKSHRTRCPGTFMCSFYQHPEIDCVHANAAYSDQPEVFPITFYHATDLFFTNDIGCYAH